MLDKFGPPFPAKLTGFGHPFHGLVEGGQLTLPNGAVMPYPQPIRGDTYRIKKPGIGPVTRTPEQQARDTAKGYQWWNEAIISGLDCWQIYGTPTGGWVYCAPSGRNWHVAMTSPSPDSLVSSDTLGDITFEVVEFGKFASATPLSDTVIATLADWQIGSSRFGRVHIEDVAPDGSEAIVSFHSTPNIKVTNYDTVVCCIIEITVAEVGNTLEITASVLEDYAAAQEQATFNIPPQQFYSLYFDDPVYTYCGPSEPTPGEWKEIEYNGGVYAEPHQNGSVQAWVTNGAELSTYSYDRTLTYWYDQSGGRHRVSCEWTIHATRDYPMPTGQTSGLYTRPCGTSTVSGSHTETMNRSMSITTDVTIAIKVDGVAQASFPVASYTHNFSITWEVEKNRSGITSESFSGSIDTSLTVAGLTYDFGPFPFSGTTQFFNPIGPASTDYHSGFLINDPSAEGTSQRMAINTVDGNLTANTDPGRPTIYLYLHRYANHLFEVRSELLGEGKGLVDKIKTSAAVAPDGAHGVSLEYTDRASAWFGSWCPVTGQVERARDEQVCWV